MPTDAIIELVAASKTYRHEIALRPTDLALRQGTAHALIGLNGAGKTTLLRLALGMEAPSGGRVLLRGTNIAQMPTDAWFRVGHVIETPFAYPELTVKNNLYLAARLAGLGHRAGKHAASEKAEEMELTHWWTRRARNLSLGNRQRVGIGAALISDPDVLVLDEPTNSLDPAGVVLVRQLLIDRVQRAGMSLLIASHHLDEVSRIADDITVINAGRVIGTLAPGESDIERRFFGMVRQDLETA